MSKAQAKILVVDDEINIREALATILQAEGYEVHAAASAEEGISKLGEDFFQVVISDMRMGGASGMDLLRWIRTNCPDTEMILLTAYGSVEGAVEAMKLGAYDYLSKPVDRRRLSLLIGKALEKQRLAEENRSLRRRLSVKEEFSNIIGNSSRIRQIFKIISEVAPTSATVLITGESGTGKELVARAIHNRSNRRDGDFVTLNCGALPDTLLESELFGYEKGAFTGAAAMKMGRIEMASGGTLFLDEVGDMTPKTQVDVLRALQDREIRRLGGDRVIKVDVRFIAATNKDLAGEIADKHFREDLYYRLNVVPIVLPALRERKEDIPVLVNAFLEEFCKLHKKESKKISDRALDLMIQYPWPGNVRELRNVAERMVLLSPNETLEPRDLPASIGHSQDSRPEINIALNQSLEDMEKAVISNVFSRITRNRRKAADILGISLRTLHYKIHKFHLD
ncbi:MAG TPA: sigma-54 dependent transcriptional regulator [Acidobacteriota bacterium]|nr:sigma-54 dependent transcriptional regulator [Acidobacteriota bacterium]